jgi:hypothetical protein
MFQIQRLILPVVLAVFLAGCAVLSPIGPIVSLGIMWVNGEAAKYYATDRDVIHAATKNVLKEFKLPILEEKIEEDTIYIKAGDDDKLKIKIVATREGVTKLLIRVNIMGDQAYAELIYRHVDEQPGVLQFASLVELNEAIEKRPRRIFR